MFRRVGPGTPAVQTRGVERPKPLPEHTRSQRTHENQFEGARGISYEERHQRASKLLAPIFKDIERGLRQRKDDHVKAGATRVAGHLDLPFAPKADDLGKQLLSLLGQLLSGNGSYTFKGLPSLPELHKKSVIKLVERNSMEMGSYGFKSNDPDPTLQKGKVKGRA